MPRIPCLKIHAFSIREVLEGTEGHTRKNGKRKEKMTMSSFFPPSARQNYAIYYMLFMLLEVVISMFW